MASRYDWPTEYVGDTVLQKTFTFSMDLTDWEPTFTVWYNGAQYLSVTSGAGLTKTLNDVVIDQFDLPTDNSGPLYMEYDLVLTHTGGAKRTFLYGRIPLIEDIAP